MASFANSDGWMEKPKAWIHSLAPLMVVPSSDGDDQERKPQRPHDVAVAIEPHVVADQEHGDDEQAGADQQPLPLKEGEGRTDAEDLREADGRQQRGDGQKEGVGLRKHETHEQVQAEEDRREDQPVDERHPADLPIAPGVDGHVGHGADGPGDSQKDELGVAPAHCHISRSRARSRALSLLIRSRPSTSSR